MLYTNTRAEEVIYVILGQLEWLQSELTSIAQEGNRLVYLIGKFS